MHVTRLALHDFRSYVELDVALEAGATTFVGANGQGKTNLVEAIDYLATLASHRVATDAPLVRHGAERAVVRAVVVKHGREALLEVELRPGQGNRARINRSPLTRPRDLLGVLRSVVFSPDDLVLVKGDPSDRRRFLDALLALRAPRLAGVKADYDKVLRQRNTLLKTAGAARRGGSSTALATLDTWDEHLARTGAELLEARLALVDALDPLVGEAYAAVASQATTGRTHATIAYKPSFDLGGATSRDDLHAALVAEVQRRRSDELDRGISLVGPHRDDVTLTLGELPAKGYASHGESWSFALALKLGSYRCLQADGDDPILVLDDVFAELDRGRRDELASLVADAEQVLVTAAVPDDVPEGLRGARFEVADGKVVGV